MKLILAILIVVALGSPVFAADTAKKKAAKTEAKEPASTGPSAEALTLAKSLTPSQKTKLMDIVNKGDDEALQSLPGIGAARAERIKAARPIADPADLTKVEGVGEATFGDIVAHAKAGFPEAEKKAAPAEKPSAKASAKKPNAKKKTAESEEGIKTAKK